MSLLAPEDIALKGLGIRLVWLIMALFLLTGAPAIGLAYFGRTPRLSLIVGGAFPVLFILMYAMITIVMI